MNVFLFLLRASWRTVGWAVLAGAASGAAGIGLVALVHTALQGGVLAPGTLMAAFAGLCVVVLATKVTSDMMLVRLAQTAVSRLSLDLCRQILAAPLGDLEEIGAHRLLAALTSDVLIISLALNGVPTVCVSAMTLVCGMAYLGWLSPLVLAAMLTFTAMGVTSYLVTAHRARRHLLAGREALDTFMRHLRSMIEGVKELKLHQARRQAFVDDVLVSADAQLRRHQILGFSIQQAAVGWGRLLFLVAIGLLLFAWPYVQTIDRATLTGYTLTILYLMTPLEKIIGWLPHFGRAQISLTKVERLGLTLGARPHKTAAPAAAPRWESVELAGVTHAYEHEKDERGFLLGPIELTLRPGDLVFVAGGNGSGKTTLAKIIMGLYAPEGGEVRLDGRPVTAENCEAYRQLFTAVFAEPTLFESLLGIGGREVDERARSYLDELHLARHVEVSGGEFSTTTKLSKGQRKRLALLTAYLEDRPIYLFDEWAADQDPAFKEIFYTEILPELKARGKAVLVITHDDRYFHIADRVIFLRDGKMVEAESWSTVRTRGAGADGERAPCETAAELAAVPSGNGGGRTHTRELP